jgi:hypothetical protein
MIYTDPKENKKIMDFYKKIYKPKILKKPIYWIEDLIFSLVFKLGSFLQRHFVAYSKRIKNRKLEKYKGLESVRAFTTDYSKYDPNINNLLNLDPKKERIYQTEEVQGFFGVLNLKTQGNYDKEAFKWDLFGHLLKRKDDGLNKVEA